MLDDKETTEFIVLGLSGVFLLLPTLINLFQLSSAVRTWTDDCDIRQIMQPWLTSNVGFLYASSIVFGSAFSAMEFCNSNLFQWNICYMNVPRKLKQKFKLKRLYSIVLFENIPQLGLQCIYSFVIDELTYVTLFAMLFSLLSIILTGFEFSTKKYLFEHEASLSVKFKVNSPQIESFSRSQFIRIIEYKRYCVSNELAKMLSIDFTSVELLKPIPSKNGAQLILYIRHQVEKANVINIIAGEIANQRLNNVKFNLC